MSYFIWKIENYTAKIFDDHCPKSQIKEDRKVKVEGVKLEKLPLVWVIHLFLRSLNGPHLLQNTPP